jgi:hypothetical protein
MSLTRTNAALGAAVAVGTVAKSVSGMVLKGFMRGVTMN